MNPQTLRSRRGSDAASLLPGAWVRVRSLPEIQRTLDENGRLDGLPIMPEMTPLCGGTYQVALRAERTCVHPPELPLRRCRDAVTLEGVRCDGSQHGGCQMGCKLFWKADWLTTAGGEDVAPPVDEPRAAATLRATRGTDPDVFMCQATELRRATSPGPPLWSPAQYLGFLEARTFAAPELAAMFAGPAARRVARLLRPPCGDSRWLARGPSTPSASSLASGWRSRAATRSSPRSMRVGGTRASASAGIGPTSAGGALRSCVAWIASSRRRRVASGPCATP